MREEVVLGCCTLVGAEKSGLVGGVVLLKEGGGRRE
jgi:hypothetical protein